MVGIVISSVRFDDAARRATLDVDQTVLEGLETVRVR